MFPLLLFYWFGELLLHPKLFIINDLANTNYSPNYTGRHLCIRALYVCYSTFVLDRVHSEKQVASQRTIVFMCHYYRVFAILRIPFFGVGSKMAMNTTLHTNTYTMLSHIRAINALQTWNYVLCVRSGLCFYAMSQYLINFYLLLCNVQELVHFEMIFIFNFYWLNSWSSLIQTSVFTHWTRAEQQPQQQQETYTFRIACYQTMAPFFLSQLIDLGRRSKMNWPEYFF